MNRSHLFAYFTLFTVACVGGPEVDGVIADESAASQLAQEVNCEMSGDKVRKLVANYYVAVRGLNADKWAATFSRRATMEDPVGSPIQRGVEQLTTSYAQGISQFSAIEMREYDVFTPDKTNEAAVRWRAALTFKNGLKVDAFNGITSFKFDNEGKITSLRAFWDPSVLLNAHY